MQRTERILRSLILELAPGVRLESGEAKIRSLNLPGIAKGIQLAKTEAAGKPYTFVRDVGDSYIYAAIGGNQDPANFEPEYYIVIYDGLRSDRQSFGKKFMPGEEGYKPKVIEDFYSVNPSDIDKLGKKQKVAVLASAVALQKAYGSMNTYQYITQKVSNKTLPAGPTVSNDPPSLETSKSPPAAGASDGAATSAIAADAVGVTPGQSSGDDSPWGSGGTGSPSTTYGPSGGTSGGGGGPGDEDDEAGTGAKQMPGGGAGGSGDTGAGGGSKDDKPKKPRRPWAFPHFPDINWPDLKLSFPSLQLDFGLPGIGWPGRGKGGEKGGGKGASGSEPGQPAGDEDPTRMTPEDAIEIIGPEIHPFVKTYFQLSNPERELLALSAKVSSTGSPEPAKTLEIVSRFPSGPPRSQGARALGTATYFDILAQNTPRRDDPRERRTIIKQFRKLGIKNGQDLLTQGMGSRILAYTIKPDEIDSISFHYFKPDAATFNAVALIMNAYSGMKESYNYPDSIVKEIARIYGIDQDKGSIYSVKDDITNLGLELNE